ncbi:helix-turn-helix transcriptional regulator [Microbacterium sp. cx-59]|uniref:helix-turn-helix domain-containing protein n=1 Tax=Microbacterium sp. cx-59 TaxID=2891207 RepID=UPI001E381EE2|nr:helix-turn-helix transcriptional regulator [Microbacterium sp. cx-59]MCC4908557.1 helix-turn-helix domain-containing protein [Microbacterium sp. cx-59]
MTPSDAATASAATGEAQIGVSLGRAIREARAAKKLSMRALATASDISQPFLSQIESGQTMPSLVTLYRLAKALELSPSALLPTLEEPELVHVSRHDEGVWVPIADNPDSATTRVLSSGTARHATVQEYIVEPGQYMGDWFQSDGELTVYVIEGAINVDIEGHGTWTLAAGDAIAHPGAIRNRWSVHGEGRARMLLSYAFGG